MSMDNYKHNKFVHNKTMHTHLSKKNMLKFNSKYALKKSVKRLTKCTSPLAAFVKTKTEYNLKMQKCLLELTRSRLLL